MQLIKKTRISWKDCQTNRYCQKNRCFELNGGEAQEIIKVINNYSSALNLLDDYDHKRITKPSGTRNEGLKEIIGTIYQTFDGSDYFLLYKKKQPISYN